MYRQCRRPRAHARALTTPTPCPPKSLPGDTSERPHNWRHVTPGRLWPGWKTRWRLQASGLSPPPPPPATQAVAGANWPLHRGRRELCALAVLAPQWGYVSPGRDGGRVPEAGRGQWLVDLLCTISTDSPVTLPGASPQSSYKGCGHQQPGQHCQNIAEGK